MQKITRGIRNCNPGNLRHGSNWEGLHPYSKFLDTDFCVFISPKFGIRAMAKLLNNYGKQSVDTIESIIRKWAPSEENETESYIRDISQRLNIPRTQHLNLNSGFTVASVVRAIIIHENGCCPYSNEEIMGAVAMAGLAC